MWALLVKRRQFLPDGSNGLNECPGVGEGGGNSRGSRLLLVQRRQEVVHHLSKESLLTAASQVA